MPKREPRLLVEDMLTAIDKVERFTAGMDRDSFQQDEKTVDAVVRNLEILGEAARQMPEDFAARHPGDGAFQRQFGQPKCGKVLRIVIVMVWRGTGGLSNSSSGLLSAICFEGGMDTLLPSAS